jgi:hypothetical protein
MNGVRVFPAAFPGRAPELRLHGIRDLIYAVLFATLPFLTIAGNGTVACEGAEATVVFA